jgi:hypothetical protein
MKWIATNIDIADLKSFNFWNRTNSDVNRAGAGGEEHPPKASPIHMDEAFTSITEATW